MLAWHILGWTVLNPVITVTESSEVHKNYLAAASEWWGTWCNQWIPWTGTRCCTSFTVEWVPGCSWKLGLSVNWCRIKSWRQHFVWSRKGYPYCLASLTQWTCVWANSGRRWRTGEPSVLQLTGLQRVRHDWVIEQQNCFAGQGETQWGSALKKLSVSTPERASLVAQQGKKPTCNAGDPSSGPGSGRSPGEGNDNPLQYFCLENPMDREAWWAIIHWELDKTDGTKCSCVQLQRTWEQRGFL